MAFKMKGFEPHNMYKTEKANTKADHDRLKKQGYDHSPYNKALVGNQDQLPENIKKEILASPMAKKVSWKYGDGTYSGDLIPSMETETHRYARTHNGKIKSLPKNK
tara:strand:+ start:150 stop:467 length:318 start_codon:yes stop_codon:yes gene_type:complete